MRSAAVKKEREQARCRHRPFYYYSRCISCLYIVIATISLTYPRT